MPWSVCWISSKSAAGYAKAKPVDVPTAMMGSDPSPAGVGRAVQSVGPHQVEGTLKKLGEQPLWDAFKKMTPGRND